MKTIIIAISAMLMLASCTIDKTAYVDNTKLIKDYEEMKQVEAKFTTRSEGMQQQMDSVARLFQADVQDYQQRSPSLSATQRQEEEGVLMQKQQRLQQQQQVQGQQLRQESDVIIDSIIVKVKGYVKTYGENNGYTYIFGSNESANIMYAKEGKDITQEILKKLNADYKSN